MNPDARLINEVDVRRVIESSTYTTTLKDLERKGKSKVRVVKAAQIYRLIAEAVNNVISKSSLTLAESERQRLVENSRTELTRILQERRKEEEEFRAQQRKIEQHLRRELDGSLQRIAELKQANEYLRKGVSAAPVPLVAAPAEPAISEEFMRSMGEQMSALKKGLEEIRQIRQEGSATVETGELAERFQKLFDGAVDRFSEHLDRKMVEIEETKAKTHVEAAEVVLDTLFEGRSSDELASNLSSVGVKQRQEGSIEGNLARLKRLAGKPIQSAEEK